MKAYLPVVAIVGRPNVGKSSIFNVLCRTRKAIVYDQSGITRDRQYGEAVLGGVKTVVIDTGGFVPPGKNLKKEDPFLPLILEQLESAIVESDVIILVLDGQAGLQGADSMLLKKVRSLEKKGEKQVFFVINKIDSEKHEHRLNEFFELGLAHQEMLALSAEHKRGFEQLESRLSQVLFRVKGVKAQGDASDGEQAAVENDHFSEDLSAIRLSIMGRPNVGKSSLTNALLGEKRTIVAPIPGTTRDAIEIPFAYQQQKYLLVDTAGIRSPGKTQGIEKLSVLKSLDAIARSFVSILVLDMQEGVTQQDAKVAHEALVQGRGILIFGNKVDVFYDAKGRLPEKTRKALTTSIYEKMPFLEFAPVILGSAKNGQIHRKNLFSMIYRIEKARHKEISTQDLNKTLEKTLSQRALTERGGKRIKIYYATQAVAHGKKRGLRPSTPTFVFFVNDASRIHFSDKRFLVNVLREKYEFFGNPIVLEFRHRGEAGKKGSRASN